jgi:hypothetical protein
MALRLYLSPTEQLNGYAGVPRTTQIFASTLGPPSNNGNYVDLGGIWAYFCTPGSGRILPVHPFTTTKPGAGTAKTISINDTQILATRPAGGTTYYRVYSPMCIGAMRITSALTVDPADWIPTGTAGQWSWQFRDENYTNGVTYEGSLNLIPAIAYIWRPSTASMVGVLWDVFAQNEATVLGCWGLSNNNYYYTYDDWSDRWNYVSGYQNCRRGAYNDAPFWESGVVTAWSSVAAQADDVMCIEYWFYSSRANSSYGSGQKVSMSIGGGTDATMDATYTNSNPLNDGSTPIHNTFIDLPTLSAISFPTDVPIPLSTGSNLVSVTPGPGPMLRLGFDVATGITGPTIGPAVSGLGVTGATQFDSTHIDLACAIRPDHPDGAADNATLVPPIGEADPLGPPVPTGAGATVI